MTETELYFAGGPEVSSWAASDCKGLTVRNEIRALNHLRKLIRANDASYKAKRECRLGLLQEVERMMAAIYEEHLPAEDGAPVQDARHQDFDAWCQEAGITADLTTQEFASTGRGMAAKVDLKAESVILTTPAAAFLNTESLDKSRFAHVFRSVKGLDEKAQVFPLLT